MARILAIDYGLKRTGIAVSDPLKMIANGLATIESPGLLKFLEDYFKKEQVELILIGEPKSLNQSDTHGTALVKKMIEQLKVKFPSIPIETIDERFTSKIASKTMVDMGLKKKQRQDKSLIDKMAATIILQDYLSRQP
ncbi:MAG: Holliday junction resolvase RuvX [Bacteroidetes bacterium]|nr:MAG: Holliday junction resolvase RuvX [Bacteroidota bacterium]